MRGSILSSLENGDLHPQIDVFLLEVLVAVPAPKENAAYFTLLPVSDKTYTYTYIHIQ